MAVEQNRPQVGIATIFLPSLFNFKYSPSEHTYVVAPVSSKQLYNFTNTLISIFGESKILGGGSCPLLWITLSAFIVLISLLFLSIILSIYRRLSSSAVSELAISPFISLNLLSACSVSLAGSSLNSGYLITFLPDFPLDRRPLAVYPVVRDYVSSSRQARGLCLGRDLIPDHCVVNTSAPSAFLGNCRGASKMVSDNHPQSHHRLVVVY